MPSTKNQDYVVEKIVSKRTDNKGRTFYLIKWKGYSTSDNSWEPENHVNNCQDLIKEYEAEQAKTNKSEPGTSKRSTRTNLSPTKKSNKQNGRSTRSSNRPSSTRQDYKRAFSNDSNSTIENEDDNGYTGKKLIKSLSTKRTRKITIDTESTPSIGSGDTDILDTTKLEQIVDVRRNKNNIIDYQIQVKKIKKPVWIQSDRLTEEYAQQVVDFLEEKYV